jgi:hypothetical protein
MLGNAAMVGTSSSGPNKLREELLKHEEMRKLLWDQTIKEKTRTETRESPRLSTSQLIPPDVSPKRVARRVGSYRQLVTYNNED